MPLNNFCVYKHVNKINGKVYIGQTCSLEKRWSRNGQNYINCPRFYSAIKKYGWDGFEHTVIQDGLTAEQADKLEIQLISQYDSTNIDKGYNLTAGGSSLASYYADPIHRKEQSERKIQYLKEHPEFQKMITQRLLDVSKTPEALAQHSKLMKQKYQDGESSLHQVNEERKKQVYCVELDMIFDSQCEATKFIGKPIAQVGNLTKVLKGERKTFAGYHWQYADRKE